MIVIGICDDESIYRKQLHKICDQYIKDENIDSKFIEFSSGEEVFNCKEKINILFLDIKMPGINGIEIKEKLSQLKSDIIIVYITNYGDRMAEAFGPMVYAFLEKPIRMDKFEKVMKVIIRDLQEDIQLELNDMDNKKKFISLKSIQYIEGRQNYTLITLISDKTYIVRKSMNTWEKDLENKDIYRVHKSFIVNFAYIQRILEDKVTMDNGRVLPISRRKRKNVKEKYDEYLFRKAK